MWQKLKQKADVATAANPVVSFRTGCLSTAARKTPAGQPIRNRTPAGTRASSACPATVAGPWSFGKGRSVPVPAAEGTAGGREWRARESRVRCGPANSAYPASILRMIWLDRALPKDYSPPRAPASIRAELAARPRARARRSANGAANGPACWRGMIVCLSVVHSVCDPFCTAGRAARYAACLPARDSLCPRIDLADVRHLDDDRLHAIRAASAEPGESA